MKLLLLLLSARFLAAFDYAPASMHHFNNAITDMTPWSNFANPSFLPFWTSAHCTGLYCKPYMIDGLESSCLSAGFSRNGFGVEAGWSTFGIKEYKEQSTGLSAGWRPFRPLSMGAGCTYYRMEIATDEICFRSNLLDYKASILLLPFDWLSVGFLQQNIHSIFDEKRRDLLYPSWSVGVAVVPVPGLHFSWGYTDSGDAFVNSITVSVNVLDCLNIKAGYARETSTGTLSASVLYRHIHLTYGLSFHTYLGASHTVAVTLTLNEDRLETLRYSRAPRRHDDAEASQKRIININRCTRQELQDIPGLKDSIADRVISYREKFGRVSVKVLVQLGLSEREVRDMAEYICGLEPDAPEGRGGRTGQEVRKSNVTAKSRAQAGERKKRIFQRLVNAGVSAGLALDVADLSEKHDAGTIRKLIEARSDIPPETRKLISTVCAGSY
jgi:DNA uptake protein ComE-like DNA-binding protein